MPAAELRDAMRWKIKDLIPMSLEQAVIDAFPLPSDTGRSDMAYAVAAERSHIDSCVNLAQSSGLQLNAIDIAELAARNLSELVATPNRSVAIVSISPGRACLNLIRDGQLYLSRRFDLNWNGSLLDELPVDTLSLELQRSLDYFERQMRQVPPQTIYLCGENITEDKITDSLRANLSATISVLPLAEQLAIPAGIEAQDLALCLNAIGAALRIEEGAAK